MLILDNPEFVRLRRIKLRPRSMFLMGVVSISVFGAMLALFQYNTRHPSAAPDMPYYFFFTALGFQIGLGALYALMLASQNITLERERNTYDFQRMVAIGPWRLGIGKLFGSSCEAFFGMLGGTLFTLYPVFTGRVPLFVWFEAQIVCYVFALLITSFGLMCSSMVPKTSYSSGMMILFLVVGVPLAFGALNWGDTIWAAASPPRLFFEMGRVCWRPGYTMPAVSFFGTKTLPMFVGFLLMNGAFTLLFFVLTVRRLTDEELSMVRPRHAAIAFAILQILLVGSGWDEFQLLGSGRTQMLAAFHIINAAALMALAFGLTPSAELLRGRVSRGRRDQHWKILGERSNRLEDCPSVCAVAVFGLAYAILAVALSMWVKVDGFPAWAIIPMVFAMGIATASLLLYISIYTERGGLKVGALIIVLSLTVPPMILGPLVSPDKVFAINPFAYMGAFAGDAELNMPGVGHVSQIACPAFCIFLALALSLLAAMRLRFLLDIDEIQRQREQEQPHKPSDKAVAAARAMIAGQEAPTATPVQTEAEQI